jgi:hypothetical protein
MSNLITVTTNADSGAGSLREAIAQAQPGDTIQFDSSLANQTITLTSGGFAISNNLTIDGAGAPGLTISGNNATRIFGVDQGGTNFTLKNLTLADAFLPNDIGGAIHTVPNVTLTVENCQFNNNVSRGGAAIFIRDHSTLTVTNCKFDGNDGATYGDIEISGGAIAGLEKCNITITDSEFTDNKGINGGAIYSIFSNLTVENSTFINNDSTPGAPLASPANGYLRGYGGAIYVDGASIPNDPRFYSGSLPGDPVGGDIIIRNSLIEGNRAAGQGGGLFLFGYPQDKVTVENSTIINNEVIAGLNGDSIGGGLRSGPTQLTINNTTFANNKALDEGGGLYFDGEDPVSITNSTFSGNQAVNTENTENTGAGGAIAVRTWLPTAVTNIVNTTFADNSAGSEAGAIVTGEQPIIIRNSIFANNTAGSSSNLNQQTNRELTDGGGNLQWSPRNPSDNNVTANILIADPQLAPLQDNGGGILTRALLPGSPAIDAGSNLGAPTTDQRGEIRPQDGDQNGTAIVDIGAYEALAAIPEIEVIEGTNNITDGTTTALEIGTTTVGTPLTKTFTVKNTGTADLNLSNLQLPTGFTLVGSLPATIAATEEATFQISLNAAAAGNFTGELSFTTNDGDENPFNFAISGTVNGTSTGGGGGTPGEPGGTPGTGGGTPGEPGGTPGPGGGTPGPGGGTPGPGGGTPTLNKTPNDLFLIQGDPGQAQLQFTLTQSDSSFVNEIGVFVVDDDQGTVNGIAPGEAGYMQAALSQGQVIFSALSGNVFAGLNSTSQLSFDVGDRLGFYLVQNSTTDTVLSKLAAGQTPPNVFFATTSANSDGFDHLQVSEGSNSTFTLAWEDQLGGGDRDFNDVALTVQLTNQPPPLGTGGQSEQELIDLRDLTGLVSAEFVVNSDAAYSNSAGFYAVDDAMGRIGNLNPGDSGYAEAAISQRVDLTAAGLPGGQLWAPFIIANGTPQEFLSNNPNNQPSQGPLAYFPYLGANPDGVDHIRQLGNNTFGFEDKFGGGDFDYNDLVVQAHFT